MAAERDNANFWLPNEHRLATFERSWYTDEVNKDSECDYTMGGELGPAEKVILKK